MTWRPSVVLQILCYALAAGTPVMATTPDSATIVNSGSTNIVGYTIVIRSDGSGTATLQHAAVGKPFHVASATVAKFFADLAAARRAKPGEGGCMKSASFGSSTHISWQGWTSTDLECPGPNAAVLALVNDLHVIAQAAGMGTPQLRSRTMDVEPQASP